METLNERFEREIVAALEKNNWKKAIDEGKYVNWDDRWDEFDSGIHLGFLLDDWKDHNGINHYRIDFNNCTFEMLNKEGETVEDAEVSIKEGRESVTDEFLEENPDFTLDKMYNNNNIFDISYNLYIMGGLNEYEEKLAEVKSIFALAEDINEVLSHFKVKEVLDYLKNKK